MSERLAYAVDDTHWPLVAARATEFVNDMSALDASYRRLELILAREQEFVLLFDMRGGASSSARRRKLLEWAERNGSALKRSIVASAVVVGSNVERGFVTAVLWVREPPWPMRVFTDSAETEQWLLAEFARLTAAKPAGR